MSYAFIEDLQEVRQVSEADIHFVECAFNIRLPEALTEYYLHCSGAPIKTCSLWIEEKEYLVARLFPLLGEGLTFMEIKNRFQEFGDLERFYYPIGHNGGGGLYLWNSLSGEIRYMADNDESPKEYLFASARELLAAMEEAAFNGEYRRSERMSRIDFKPLGSVVLLKGGSQRMIIIARGLNVESEGETFFFDYGAVPYPEGLTGDQMAYFNHDAIARVFFEGYRDDENDIMEEQLNEYVEQNPGLKRKVFGAQP